MIKNGPFYKLFLIFYCPVVAIMFALLYLFGSPEKIVHAIWGSGISVFLIAVTVIMTDQLIERSIPLLLSLVVGGFLFRLFFVMGAALVVVLKTEFDLLYFFSSLFGSYFALQALEVVYLQNRMKNFDRNKNEGA